MLKHLMVEIYNGCNYRCNMCTIWTNKGVHIDVNLLGKFLRSPVCSAMESLGITGGEPMMSNQLSEITALINEFHQIKAVYITSNGWFPDRLLKFVSEFKDKDVYVNISLDGPKEIHNKIRGIEAFDRAIDTVKRLKQSGLLKDVGVKMTVQNDNMDHVLDVYNLSKELDVTFGLMPVVVTEAYFKNNDTLKGIRIQPGTDEGNAFRRALAKLQRHLRRPYIDMLLDLYKGKERDMERYGCMFPKENNMLYADGTLGICFMTGRYDVKDYLARFESYEKENKDFREEARVKLAERDCKTCPASCASSYKIGLARRALYKLERLLLS